MRRRQKFQRQRRATARQRWMRRQSEQFLYAHREQGAILGGVIQRMTRADRRFEARRRLIVEAPHEFPWQQMGERRIQIVGGDVGETGPALNEGRQPLRRVGGKRRIAEIGKCACRTFGAS